MIKWLSDYWLIECWKERKTFFPVIFSVFFFSSPKIRNFFSDFVKLLWIVQWMFYEVQCFFQSFILIFFFFFKKIIDFIMKKKIFKWSLFLRSAIWDFFFFSAFVKLLEDCFWFYSILSNFFGIEFKIEKSNWYWYL